MELTGLQKCINNMISKKIKLVNVVQVMLFHRILPCQSREFNLWEFDSAEHQTLRELFDTTHKDVWKVLFKGAEVPPPLTEDRGLIAKRPANPVSLLYLTKCLFSQHNSVRGLILHAILTGLGSDSGADQLSGPIARRSSKGSLNGDAGSGAL